MSSKTKNIVGWVLSGLLGALFLFSASGKLMGGEEAVKMASGLGINASTFTILGVVEVLSLALFLYPRTGVLGTLLLSAYMGGAIATHLEHGESFAFQCVIQAVLWITAIIRFPELKSRIMSSNS
jgi:hypothetical protein